MYLQQTRVLACMIGKFGLAVNHTDVLDFVLLFEHGVDSST